MSPTFDVLPIASAPATPVPTTVTSEQTFVDPISHPVSSTVDVLPIASAPTTPVPSTVTSEQTFVDPISHPMTSTPQPVEIQKIEVTGNPVLVESPNSFEGVSAQSFSPVSLVESTSPSPQFSGIDPTSSNLVSENSVEVSSVSV